MTRPPSPDQVEAWHSTLRRERDGRYGSLLPSMCVYTCGAAIGAVACLVVLDGSIANVLREGVAPVSVALLWALVFAGIPAAFFGVAALWTMELRRRRAPGPLPTFVVAIAVGAVIPVLTFALGEWLLTVIALAILSGVLLCRRPVAGL